MARPASSQAARQRRSGVGNFLRTRANQHRGSAAESLLRLLQRPWTSILTVLVMGLAIALPLLLFLIAQNAQQLSTNLRDSGQITVFLDVDTNDESAQALLSQLAARDDVTAVQLRTPEQGLDEVRSWPGFSEALDLLDENPLPFVLAVEPRGHVDDSAALLTHLRAHEKVALVQYDAVWQQRLAAAAAVLQRMFVVLAMLLALATTLVVGNTVRLDLQARAEEIAVMQLMGANASFVRRPFLYAGLYYGLASGLLAVAAVSIIELALATPLAQLVDSYQERFVLHGLALHSAALVVAASAGLGWSGAALTSSAHLIRGNRRQ